MNEPRIPGNRILVTESYYVPPVIFSAEEYGASQGSRTHQPARHQCVLVTTSLFEVVMPMGSMRVQFRGQNGASGIHEVFVCHERTRGFEVNGEVLGRSGGGAEG